MAETKDQIAVRLVHQLQSLPPNTEDKVKNRTYDDIYNQLYGLYKDDVVYKCKYFCRNRADVEEISNTVWRLVYERLRRFKYVDEKGNILTFKKWLNTIAKNECLHFKAKQKTRKAYDHINYQEYFGVDTSRRKVYTPYNVAVPREISLETIDMVEKTIERMPEEYKDIIACLLNDDTNQEIAEKLGISKAAAKRKKFNAHAAARKIREEISHI